jgi:hypothetical protein
VFFAISQNSEKFFYSFSHKDLSAFRGIPKIGIFVKIAQVRPNYRGTMFLELGRTLSKADSLLAASNGSDRNRFPLRGNDKHAPIVEECAKQDASRESRKLSRRTGDGRQKWVSDY